MKLQTIWPGTEEELGRVVVDFLKRQGWTIYQEVQLYTHICDILAKKDGVYWIVECKRTFSLALIGQAYDWLYYANQVSVAVPVKAMTRGQQMAEIFCRHLGIGVMYFYENRTERSRFDRDIEPCFNEKTDMDELWSFLSARHKTYARAGNSDGKRLTPFSNTCIEIRKVLAQHKDGLPLKELIQKVDHHYVSDASARSTLRKRIDEGLVPGVGWKKDGKRYLYFLKEVADE